MKMMILLLAMLAGNALAEDTRQFVKMSPAAEESLRQEMLGNMVGLNEVLSLIAQGKVKEAGVVAEAEFGVSAQGKHRNKPMDARPGPQMPPEMHQIGMNSHKAASEFAKVAATGDREKALALLPNLTGACVACHSSYRTR